MNRLLSLLLLALIGMAATVASAQTPRPLLYYTFNETGTTAVGSGTIPVAMALLNASGTGADLHSAPGFGVSGLADDRAFDNTASTGMGSAGIGGVALVPPNSLPSMSSFTFETWVYVNTELNNSARILDDTVTNLECGSGGVLRFYVNSTSTFVSSAAAYSLTGQWMFIAVTYDGTKSSNNVVFYIGTKTQAVTQVGTVETLPQGTVTPGGNDVGFGNARSFTNTRPVDGYMDDIRLFAGATDSSGVLTQAQLETLREQDVQNASVPLSPLISSTLSATGTGNFGFSYQIAGSDSPTRFSESGLPPELGLSVNQSTGIISGTPTETGTFQATISAINLGGTGSSTLTLVVVPPPIPSISSSLSASATNGLPFEYQIQAQNNPTGFSASGLPSGLSCDPSLGMISGTPSESGTFDATISAVNLGGSDAETLAFNVVNPPAPEISSTLSATGTNGTAFSYQITANDYPASFTASGLPNGLQPDDSTGLISGTPMQTGTFDATISALNAGGTDNEILVLTILPPPPVITSGLAVTGSNGAAFSYQIEASNLPASFSASGLPPGLTVDPSLGVISGTLAAGGIFPIAITATNPGGTGSASLILTVQTKFTNLQGSYAGLGAIGGTNDALFTVTILPNGVFTGKLETAAAVYPVNGTFAPNGAFDRVIDAGSVDAVLSVDAVVPGVSGTISVAAPGGFVAYAVQSSALGKFSVHAPPGALAGAYTAVVPALTGTDPTLPHAPGYATISVTDTGVVTMGGKLGDGTPFNVRAQLGADGKTWTLFDPLYAGRHPGTIAGTMTFGTSATSDCAGTLDWVKPAQTSGHYYADGFALSADMMAAKYSPPPLAPGAASITVSGANLSTPAGFTDGLTISTRQVVSVTSPDTGSVTVKLTLSTGAFSGTFRNSGLTGVTSFGGVIYQMPSAAGFGSFLGTNQSGTVSLTQ